MLRERGISSLAIDLSRMHRRTVTSFYSNLVTRPTGRAIRMGVESQLGDLGSNRPLCLSVLDFSQVRVLDYSCADEIIAKLLLRYAADDRPFEAYFVVRGLQEHHEDSVEAVLERHRLLLVVEDGDARMKLLGPTTPFERVCWNALAGRKHASPSQIAQDVGLAADVVATTLAGLAARRVVVPLGEERCCALSALTREGEAEAEA